MDLLHACRGGRGLGTAALLRRSHPFDKELQVAGLVHEIGTLLCPGDRAFRADYAAATAVRPLLGERVALLLALAGNAGSPGIAPAGATEEIREAAATLRQARDAAVASGLDAGVLEDWQPVLELVAAGAYRPGRPARPARPLN
ncbi:metal-dependent phosphohydrolase, partial [Streptomyces sp. NPDC059447]|uniref:metal-dependent phosphohydrolase n=1 Tax=Streptomyces sp. NPDC059447 TaxID=3346834 RepID=UPI0036C07E38